MVLNQT